VQYTRIEVVLTTRIFFFGRITGIVTNGVMEFNAHSTWEYRQHVRKWCQEISGCRVSVTDEQRSGRPSTSADLVPAIEETVRANRRVLLKGLEEQFNLSRGTIWDIFHEHLWYRKVCNKWVPQHLTRGPQEKPYGCIPHSFPLL